MSIILQRLARLDIILFPIHGLYLIENAIGAVRVLPLWNRFCQSPLFEHKSTHTQHICHLHIRLAASIVHLLQSNALHCMYVV